jgi:hypothetical protein
MLLQRADEGARSAVEGGAFVTVHLGAVAATKNAEYGTHRVTGRTQSSASHCSVESDYVPSDESNAPGLSLVRSHLPGIWIVCARGYRHESIPRIARGLRELQVETLAALAVQRGPRNVNDVGGKRRLVSVVVLQS